MRAFIAINLSPEIKKELAGLQEDLARSLADVKWVETENIHLTLKFLGEVTEEYIEKVKTTLDAAVSGSKPFEISLSGLGAFPGLDNPRVVWMGLEKGAREIEVIAKKIEDEFEKLGFAKEERPFTAHLTIGRVRGSKNKDLLKSAIETRNAKHRTDNHQLVSSITLYQSTLTSSGPIYTSLHAIELQ